MTDTVHVANRFHMAIRMTEPLPDEFRDKPGLAPTLRSMVLPGSHNGDGAASVTRDVDAGLFHSWLEGQRRINSPLADMVSEVSDEDASKPNVMEYGFEPALERMKGETGGSTVTHEGPVSSAEMAATSDTPNDDTPRGDPDVVPTAHTQVPATAEAEGKV